MNRAYNTEKEAEKKKTGKKIKIEIRNGRKAVEDGKK